jgi:hypothetical protein
VFTQRHNLAVRPLHQPRRVERHLGSPPPLAAGSAPSVVQLPPSTWAVLLIGFGRMGFIAYRRSRLAWLLILKSEGAQVCQNENYLK